MLCKAQKHDEAITLFSDAADVGETTAMVVDLATLYMRKVKGTKPAAEAKRLLSLAVERNDCVGAYRLGSIYAGCMGGRTRNLQLSEVCL